MKEQKVLSQKEIEKMQKRKEQALINQVKADFLRRQRERLPLERQWELNMNFLAGNQYCEIGARGEINQTGKEYYWQNRGVFNHVAPIFDSRLARFEKVMPEVSVRPRSDDDKDVIDASIAEKLIAEAFKRTDFKSIESKTINWAETCGTGFYKVVWDSNAGVKVGVIDGEPVYEGDVNIIPVSPFEIFPDSIYTQNIEDVKSIIHARAVSVDYVREKYGVIVDGKDINVNNLATEKTFNISGEKRGVLPNATVVIERYDRPSKEYPNGRLITIAGDKLLYLGDLPYLNGKDGTRSLPFVKQVSFAQAGNFFGVSIIERLIPIQRAFNAVKNRKHEFLNRLSMGIMTVEDGSIDVDDLAEEGLSPGKVLVYRQGSNQPKMLEDVTMPNDFNDEEEKLLNEFVVVSGVSDVSSSSSNAALSSGSALEILMEQDNSRLVTTAEYIRQSIIEVAKQVIRLYAQFTVSTRVVKHQGDFGKIKIYYADKSVAKSDDVYLESENELLYTNRQRKDMVFKLLDSGLLHDDNGKLRANVKEKVLSLLGYKDLDYQKGLARLQEEKAQSENERLLNEYIGTEEIDDHSIHVDEHTRYVLCEYQDFDQGKKQRFYAHINEHKQKLNKGENKDGTIQ